ncbi:MAG: tcrA1 [Pseudonocardiales bacterium]|nr:tcrA1 [Pseudonocardiales bacterium]
MRVLVVEDDRALLETLRRGLHERGYTVDIAGDGTTGLAKSESNDYDVIVLDRDLPGIHGDEICRRLNAASSSARILMLTASAALDDLLEGLDLGADDYLTKPFRFAELAARVRALSRRAGRPQAAVMRNGDLELDPARMTAARGEVQLSLTHREFAVLELLMRAGGEIVSAETLIEKVWDEHADPFTSSVRVIMTRLRAKLGPPPLIHTVVGRGYRL